MRWRYLEMKNEKKEGVMNEEGERGKEERKRGIERERRESVREEG